MPIVRSVVVDRHIDDVFAYLARRERDREWWGDVVAVEQVGGDEPGDGALYAVTLRRGRRVTASCAWYEPPVRLAWREEDGSGAPTLVVYDLAEVWTATRVTRTEESGAAGPVARLRRTRRAGRALADLARRLEGRR